LPASAWAGVLTIAQVITVALAAGSVSVLFTTAYRVLLPSLVTPEELIEGNAKLQGSAAAAAIGGRAASGIAANLAYSGSTALVVLLLVRVIGFGPAAAGRGGPEPGPLGNGSAAIPAGTCGPDNRAERGFRRAGTERDARCPRRTRTWSAAW
jgi:hypothetical protein